MAEDGEENVAGGPEGEDPPVAAEEVAPVLEQSVRLRITFRCEREVALPKQEEGDASKTESPGEEGEEEKPEGENAEADPEPSVSSIAVKCSVPLPGSSEKSFNVTFDGDEDRSSKVAEECFDFTSSEDFVRFFVSKGHTAKMSMSFDCGGRAVSQDESLDLSGFLVGDKVKKFVIAGPKPLKKALVQFHMEKLAEVADQGGEEEKSEGEEQEAASKYVPCGMLTPDLVDLLNPFVFKISQLESLPDRPATRQQLDELCEPVSIRYTFFDTRRPDDVNASVEEKTGTPLGYGKEVWYKGLEAGEWSANDVKTMSYRDVSVSGTRVYFLGDCDEDEVFKHFFYDKIPVEVHDRLPTPEDIKVVRTASQEEGEEVGSPEAEAGVEAGEEAKSKGEGNEDYKTYVCGLAHISLREFCMGYTSYENSVNIFPYTSIRGGADLDWKTRPGRYVESGAQVSYVCRLAKSLKDAGRHRYFQRAVFLLDYNDNLLLRSVLDLVTAVNQEALRLRGSKALILQTLATYKFEEEQAKSTSLDVLTGFQIIDDRMRLIVIEGLKNGAMAHVRDLVEATTSSTSYLEGQKEKQKKDLQFTIKDFEKGGVRKHLLYNPALCYSKRLYTSLGAQIHPIKLSAPLAHIMANCHTHSGRKVREQCREGLIRLNNLCRITWLRQADRMQLLPTSEMLNFIDKKFGGELTKKDEEGVLQSVEGSQPSMAENSSDLSLTNFLSARKMQFEQESSKSPKSSGAKQDLGGKSTRYSYSKPILDFNNKEFEEERKRREEKRKERNFLDEYIKQLPEIEKMAQSIRDEWFAWNPQRLKTLQTPLHAIRTMRAFDTSPKKLFGSASEKKKVDEKKVDHRPEFIFPAPKNPWEYNAHPKRPTKARIEELQQPWIENEFYGSLVRYDDESDIVPFKTIMPAPAILEKNPDFFTSVHLCGEGLIKEQEEAKQQEIKKWESKVVVDDPHFYSIIKSRKQVSQTDRNEITLKGTPMKKGFKISHAKPLPTSMHINEPYEEGDDQFLFRKVDPTKFKGSKDFARYIMRHPTMISKPPAKKG